MLEKRGVLSEVKAKLRSEVFKSLDDQASLTESEKLRCHYDINPSWTHSYLSTHRVYIENLGNGQH